MAIRGKVKTIKVDPMGKSASGTVKDTANNVEYQFVQPFGEQLGLQVNDIVQFETVNTSAGPLAVSLDPVDKGTVQSIDYASGNGVLTDKSGTKLEFVQNYAQELGIAAGTPVKFATILVGGVAMATSLRIPSGASSGSN